MSDNSYINWDAQSDQAISKIIGAYIKENRLNQNKTQEELATAAGISRSTLSLLERGQKVNLSTLIQVLRILGLLYTLQSFVVQRQISPMLLAEMDMKKRKRSRKSASDNSKKEKKSDW